MTTTNPNAILKWLEINMHEYAIEVDTEIDTTELSLINRAIFIIDDFKRTARFIELNVGYNPFRLQDKSLRHCRFFLVDLKEFHFKPVDLAQVVEFMKVHPVDLNSVSDRDHLESLIQLSLATADDCFRYSESAPMVGSPLMDFVNFFESCENLMMANFCLDAIKKLDEMPASVRINTPVFISSNAAAVA